jgi:hypothetical protein
MRHLAAALLVLLSSGCDAQKAQPDLRAPVNVATKLYVDCLSVKLSERIEIEPTAVGVNDFIEGVDDWCLTWTVIWFRPLLGFGLEDRPDYVVRFNGNRMQVLSSIRRELVAQTKPR